MFLPKAAKICSLPFPRSTFPFIFKASYVVIFSDPSSLVISPSDFLQDTYAYIGIIRVIQGNLTILRTSDQQTLIAFETLIPPFYDVLRSSRNFCMCIVGRILLSTTGRGWGGSASDI